MPRPDLPFNGLHLRYPCKLQPASFRDVEFVEKMNLLKKLKYMARNIRTVFRRLAVAESHSERVLTAVSES